MLLDQVTQSQIQAARMLSGATMAALIGARLFGRHARVIRLVAAGIYIAAMLGFLLYAIA